MSYLKDAVAPKNQTPQSQKIRGQEDRQVENSAGGISYGVDDFTRLHRFLILGSEGGSYYASQQKLSRDNAEAVLRCLKADGPRTVSIICDVSVNGRAPKNEPAIFALALASAHGNAATRRAASDAIVKVCRTGTHLFQFADYRDSLSGWSRASRRGVANWYTEKDLDALAYQIVKYRQRDGWTHRDVLRVAHPKANSPEQNLLFGYAADKHTPGDIEHTIPHKDLPKIIHGFEAAQRAKTPQETAALVREHRLPREALRTEHLNDCEVWQAMLDTGMPMTALIRNLATMTRNGLIVPNSATTKQIIEQITDQERIMKARVHPIAVLMALRTYAAGHSLRGSNTWAPVPQIIDALDEAFYMAFGNVQPTGKTRMIALDISGSMWVGQVAGIPGFTPAEASGAMAMVSMKSGDPYEVVAFTSGGYRQREVPNKLIEGLSAMSLSPRQRLDDVCKAMQAISRYMGDTDCALPMQFATKTRREIDVFEVMTDSETWAGGQHPSEALMEYRQKSGRDSKLAVYGMVSNGFSIADPNDPGMLDVVGFDTAVPNLVSAFINGGF